MNQVSVLIASYLEPKYVEQIAAVDQRIHVHYQPELLPTPRYPSDHVGTPRELSDSQEQQWRSLLAGADVLFDFDYVRRDQLPELAPNLRWLQATSAGIGQFVKRMAYDQRMPETTFTTSSGVHAQPLAEFAVMAMLAHFRGLRHLQEEQHHHRWARFATTDMAGRTLAVIGLGKIGQAVARLGKALNMRVIGTKTQPSALSDVDQLFTPDQLAQILPKADVVVLAVPHTPDTEQMIGKAELNQMKRGAYLVNIARGAVVDEPALIDALADGQVGGAALDVFAQEPLPADSPLWDMPNVLVSPHSASTSDRENERITALFCDNLSRFLADRPLRNVLQIDRLY